MKIAIIHTNDISNFDAAFSQMSPQRQTQCARLASPQARLLCVAADMAARQLAGDWEKDAAGKPICSNGYLSVAHCGEYAVAVHADTPVGVDIETNRALSPALARRLGGNDPLISWIKKEAYGKALGVGIYPILDTDIPDGWDFFFPDAPHGYHIAICKKQES